MYIRRRYHHDISGASLRSLFVFTRLLPLSSQRRDLCIGLRVENMTSLSSEALTTAFDNGKFTWPDVATAILGLEDGGVGLKAAHKKGTPDRLKSSGDFIRDFLCPKYPGLVAALAAEEAMVKAAGLKVK
jgi:hypothetical protein